MSLFYMQGVVVMLMVADEQSCRCILYNSNMCESCLDYSITSNQKLNKIKQTIERK